MEKKQGKLMMKWHKRRREGKGSCPEVILSLKHVLKLSFYESIFTETFMTESDESFLTEDSMPKTDESFKDSNDSDEDKIIRPVKKLTKEPT